LEYHSGDLDSYRMRYGDPHRQLETLEREIAVVDEALAALVSAEILPHGRYDHERFLAHRRAVAERFDIPWTAITPRMQRLLYAVNAIVQPANLLAAGVFCGNTFISNAGAGVGPGSCYQAERLIGVEIVAEEAERAERNVRLIDPSGVARVVAADAIEVAQAWQGQIDLLYLDADGVGGQGKDVYKDILDAAMPHLAPHAVLLAHNSHNCAGRMARYLDFVRDRGAFSSVNVVFDVEGLEVSRRT